MRRGACGIVREDHLAHGQDALCLEEHVLGAAKADAFGAELARLACIARGVGVGAHAKPALGIRPLHQRGEGARQLGLAHLGSAGEHLTGAAIDGDDVALLEDTGTDLERAGLCIDAHRAGTRNARASHAASNHRGMAGHATARSENADGGVHAVNVLGARFQPHKNDFMAVARARSRRRRR